MAGAEEVKIHVKKLLALFVGFVAYLFLGAVIFHHLESDNENDVRMSIRDKKIEILMEHPCLSEDAIEDLVTETKRTISSGIDPLGNSTSPTNWDYSSAFFFSGTVVTTIGKITSFRNVFNLGFNHIKLLV